MEKENGNELSAFKAKVRLHAVRHRKINETNYLYFIVALAAGIAAGAFVVGCLDGRLTGEIGVIFENYGAALESGDKSSWRNILYDNILPVTRHILILAVCGMTPIAVWAGIILLAAKGFAVGFFVAAAACVLEFKVAAFYITVSAPFQLISAAVMLLAAGVSAAHLKIGEKKYVYGLELGVLYAVYVLSVMGDLALKGLLV